MPTAGFLSGASCIIAALTTRKRMWFGRIHWLTPLARKPPHGLEHGRQRQQPVHGCVVVLKAEEGGAACFACSRMTVSPPFEFPCKEALRNLLIRNRTDRGIAPPELAMLAQTCDFSCGFRVQAVEIPQTAPKSPAS